MGGRSERRDPTKPGLAGLTADDWAALAEGRVSVGELAARVGVSPSAISRRRKRRQAQASPAGGSPSLSPAAAGAGVGPTSLPDLAVSFAMWGVFRAHEALAGGGLGPAAVKSAVQAGVLALEELRRGGFLPDVEAADGQPVELRVVLMSDEEAAAIKAAPPDYRQDDDE